MKGKCWACGKVRKGIAFFGEKICNDCATFKRCPTCHKWGSNLERVGTERRYGLDRK